jgi:hypothetical protein
MNRSTWMTLAVFALLLGMWFMQSRPAKNDAPPPLSIDGYIGNVGIEEARTLGQKQPAPYTHIAITRTDAKDGKTLIELEKLPDEKPAEVKPGAAPAPPPEAKWRAQRTAGDKKTLWKAQGFRATTMVEQLQRSIRSNFAVKFDAKGAAEYGLDPEHAIDVELSGGGKPAVKLRIGLLQKAEKDGEATTWVSDPARPEIAYQLAGRDLRTAFDIAWNELRDRQLLTLDIASVDRLELQRPGETPERIVVTRTTQVGDKAGQLPQMWTIAEPTGFMAGDIDEWLKAIERLSAAEFVPAGEEAVKSSGLDSPSAIILTINNSGKEGAQKTVLQFGQTVEVKGNKETWLRVVGRDEVYRVASYQRDQVVLALDRIRERHVLAGKGTKDLKAFAISGPGSHLNAVNTDGGWQIKGVPNADTAKVAAFLSAVDGLKVDFLPSAPTPSELDAPEWTIQWTFNDGNQTIALAKEDSEAVYGKMLDRHGHAEVFKLTPWNAKQIKKQAADFTETSGTTLPRRDQPPPPVDLQHLPLR